MSYKINFEKFSNNIVLPFEIFDVDFETFDADFLKVALVIFKSTDKIYEIEDISDTLNISHKKVRHALEYWSERKILKYKGEAQQKSKINNINKQQDNVSNIDVVQNNRPQAVKLQNKEIVQNDKSQNEEVKFLLEAIQTMFNHTIGRQYHETLTYVVEELKLPTDVILLAFHYCDDTMDKFNIKYFQQICISWAEMQIYTSEKADKYLLELKQSSPEEEKIKEMFRINHMLKPKEKEYIRVWTKDYCYDVDMISCAGELTHSKTGQYSLPYMNTVLAGWYGSCYTDISQVQHLLPENKRNNIVQKTNTNSFNKSNGSNTSSSSSSSFDLKEVEKMWNEVVPRLI